MYAKTVKAAFRVINATVKVSKENWDILQDINMASEKLYKKVELKGDQVAYEGLKQVTQIALRVPTNYKEAINTLSNAIAGTDDLDILADIQNFTDRTQQKTEKLIDKLDDLRYSIRTLPKETTQGLLRGMAKLNK